MQFEAKPADCAEGEAESCSAVIGKGILETADFR